MAVSKKAIEVHHAEDDRVREESIGLRELRIQVDGSAEQAPCLSIGIRGGAVERLGAKSEVIPRLERVAGFACDSTLLRHADFRIEAGRDSCCDIGLHIEDVRDTSIVALGPDLPAVLCLGQLRRDT